MTAENQGRRNIAIGASVKADKIEPGGKAIAVNIENLMAEARQRPLGADEVAAYLRKVRPPVAEKRLSADVDERSLQRFYGMPFHVYALSGRCSERLLLGDALEMAFAGPAGGEGRGCAVILAEGGSGKTLALYALRKALADLALPAWQAQAEAEQSAAQPLAAPERPRGARVPLLLHLSALQSDLSLLRLARIAFNGVAEMQASEEQIAALLPHCTIMLDGLDELPAGSSLEKVRAFMQEYAAAQFIVTARVGAYREQLGASDVFRLDDLNDEEVASILGERWENLNASLRPFARNRTLLRLIIVAGAADLGPMRSRGRLVQYLTFRRFSFSDDSGAASGMGDLDPEMVEGLLEHLAYAFHERRSLRLEERQVMETISAYLQEWREPQSWREVARALRQPLGLLRRSSERTWAFCDRLTQAYFAAAHAARDPHLARAAIQHLADPWWHEALDLLVGLTPEAGDLLLRMVDQDPIAAARCIYSSAVDAGRQVTNALFYALEAQRSVGWGVERERLVRAMAGLNHPDAWSELLAAIASDPYSLVILAGARAYGDLRARRRPLSITAAPDCLARPAEKLDIPEVLDLWLAHGRGDSALRSCIEERLIEVLESPLVDDHLYGVAAIALGLIGSERARGVLLARFNRAEPDGLRPWCITDALAQIRHPEVAQAAVALYNDARRRSSAWIDTRARAVYLLGWVGRPQEVAPLLFHALVSRYVRIRRRAAQALGRLQPDGSLLHLEQRLVEEPDEQVVDKIASALATLGGLETVVLLERRLRTIEHANTRRHIREAITEIRARYEVSAGGAAQ